MKKLQRLLSVFVIVLLLFTSIPLSLSAEAAETSGQAEPGPWTFSAFGGNTSPGKNPEPAIENPSTVTLTTYGGKISGTDEGLSFYYRELPATANFELRARATVIAFNSNSGVNSPNQKSFGLMLRDTVNPHGSSSTTTSNYAAAGALDLVMKGFYKNGTGQAESVRRAERPCCGRSLRSQPPQIG